MVLRPCGITRYTGCLSRSTAARLCNFKLEYYTIAEPTVAIYKAKLYYVVILNFMTDEVRSDC